VRSCLKEGEEGNGEEEEEEEEEENPMPMQGSFPLLFLSPKRKV
jgi:hypothetical protein